MVNRKRAARDCAFTLFVLAAAFCVSLVLWEVFDTRTMVPMIFVLGVFLVSLRAQGYFWGIAASLLSVLAVNYAFTFPYWAFDLISPECISSAVVMLIVAAMTGALTTKLKQQEKMKAEAENERMRGDLLRAISHDLRTPLTSIYGACSVMLDKYDELPREKHLKMLSDICTDAQGLIRMVENLLSITRVDRDSVRLTKQDTPLEELTDDLLVKFHKHYPNQRVDLDLPEDFVSIPMDAMLIELVLMNLLENAVFHAEGMTRLSLRAWVKGRRVYFEVADDGCGIPAERMARLFTGLPGTGTIRDTSRSSMGIGLSVCKAIIKAHGGQIWSENRPEGGAAFRFWLEIEEEQQHGEQ